MKELKRKEVKELIFYRIKYRSLKNVFKGLFENRQKHNILWLWFLYFIMPFPNMVCDKEILKTENNENAKY